MVHPLPRIARSAYLQFAGGIRFATIVFWGLATGCGDAPPGREVIDSNQAALGEWPYTPGVAAFGTKQYVEYIPGNLPLIFSAAHGGLLSPADIAVRTEAACGGDFATIQ